MEKIKAKVGETFKIGKHEFIRFGECHGGIAVVNKDSLFHSHFGENNDFSKSVILERLVEEYLPEIEREIGAENILEFDTDLISLDGSKKHGVLRSKVSLPTFDFYRSNRSIFEMHKIDKWVWLATPWETSEYTNDNWCVCVSPRGDFLDDVIYGGDGNGVRPFWIFSSAIFESSDE